MAEWLEARWDAQLTAPSRADRRSGRYRPYSPDLLGQRALRLSDHVNQLAWQAETEVRRLGDRPGSRGLEALARFLLRSEAIASSRIEGLRVAPQQVGLAELAEEEGLPKQGAGATARMVAANIAAVRHATVTLAAEPAIEVRHIARLQEILLSSQPQLHGIRDVQNWIGGNDHHPLDADFVPPAPTEVDRLMRDLAAYMNGGTHAALIQAGLTHAQFETIHPFRDGNGRVGRALIHTVLVRRGLTRTAVLPISLVLLTRSDEYVEGLTAYRYTGSPESDAGEAGVSAWLSRFLSAARTAVTQAEAFADQLDELRSTWESSLSAFRATRGLRPSPRSGSATARILENLHEHPVMTAATVARLYDVSDVAAKSALDELGDAQVLTRRNLDGRSHVYLAMDVFDLLTLTERRLASTRWDTTQSPPARQAPSPPQR